MADTLESLEIEVVHNASGAADSITEVTESIRQMGKALGSVLPQLQNFSSTMRNMSRMQGGMNLAQQTKVDVPQQTPLETQDTGALDSVTSSLDAADIDRASSGLQKLRDVAANIAQVVRGAFSTMKSDVEKVSDVLRSVGTSATKAKSGVDGAKLSIKQLSKEATKSQSPLGGFLASLKRIAFYRIIRGIIKSITQAFQEGLEKAYLFSSGISGEGNRFAAALDVMKSAGNQMKGQLGSAFISLLAAVEPVIVALINLVTKAADAISQFLAAFTGKTYLKANATAAKFADNMARGGAAAKEWRNQLLGFDEINRLNEPNKGGGGSGSNPLDGFAFEDAPISEFWLNLVEKIQPIVDKIKLTLDGLAEFAKGIFTGDWQMAFDGAAKAVENFSKVISDTLELTKEPINSFFEFATERAKGLGEYLDEKYGTDGVFSKIAYYVVYAMNLIKYTIESIIGKLQIVIQGFGKIVSDVLRGDWDAAWEDAAGLVSALSIEIGESIADMAKQATDELFGLDSDTNKSMSDIAKSFGDAKQPANDLALAIVNGLASSANVSADAADAFGTNMESIRSQLAATGASSLSATANENGITFKSFIANAWTAVKRVLANPLFFANGGFPDTGSLYFAGERGPELVGTMGNRNAVANNDQIVEGIRQGVYDAVVAANGNGNNDVSVRVYLDSKEIKAGQQRLDRAWGV